jgi:hypothetical protein
MVENAFAQVCAPVPVSAVSASFSICLLLKCCSGTFAAA